MKMLFDNIKFEIDDEGNIFPIEEDIHEPLDILEFYEYEKGIT